MTKQLIFATLSLFTPSMSPSQAATLEPRLVVVVASTQLSARRATDAFTASMAVFEKQLCHEGDTMLFYDGEGRRIAKLVNPPGIAGCERKFQSFKMKGNRSGLQALAPFFKGLIEADYQGAEPGRINIPFIVDVVSEALVEYPRYRKDVAIFGTSIHRDQKSGLDLTDSFPSDGNLDADPFSVWATASRTRDLTGVDVHILHEPDEFFDDLHGQMMQRFMALYVQALGGRLVTFGIDPHIGDRMGTPLPAITAQRNGDDKEAKLISLRRKVVERETLSNLVGTEDGDFVLWIEWEDRAVDLDLYIPRDRSCSIEISRAHPKCSSGAHPIFVTRDGSDAQGYEKVVVLDGNVRPDSLRVAINYASGQGLAGGRFYLKYRGVTYQTDFQFTAQTGNGGNAEEPAAWVEVDLEALIRG